MGSVIDVVVHVVWSTRFRRPTIAVARDAQLARSVAEAGRSVGCEVLAVGNASDHVHAVVQLGATIALATLAQRIKGTTSHAMHVAWQRHYWAESVSPIEVDPLLDYVRAQRARHDNSHPDERWQFASPL
ncbi:MAG TPA: transposase [Polyangiaceae bacterium]|jgi:REP element-mobilizing transposase RayT